jgi:hypothetical protein
MADERSLSDLMWDYGVYAPIGLAVSLVEEMPRLSEKGKERAASQIHLARVVGKMAVGQGKRRLGRLFGEAPRPSATGPAATGPSATGPAGADETSTTAARASRAASSSDGRTGSSKGSRSDAARRSAPGALRATEPVSAVTATLVPPAPAAPSGESLAIPGYDTLAASQVVQRLSSLRPDELEAIRRYELATRGRRTILHRIAQLVADR